MIVELPADRIVDRQSFHAEVASALHFPAYYGYNLDALDECLRDLVRSPDWHVLAEGEHLVIDLGEAGDLFTRLPWEVGTLVDIVANINRDFVDDGEQPRIFLAYRGRVAQPATRPAT